jgi:predicted nucleotidyltransferase
MVSAEMIDKLVRTLVAAASPPEVILFGSYAWGEAGDDSDIDLLVVDGSVPSKREEIVNAQS